LFLSRDNNAEVISLVSKDDTFQILYEKCYNPIFKFFFNKAFFNHFVAEDLTQETFIKAYCNLDKVRDYSTVESWLYVIANNTFNDYCRDIKRKEKHRNYSELDYNSIKYTENTPDHLLLCNEFKGMFGQIFMTLPPKYRCAVFLHEYKNYSYSQAATAMGLTLSAYTSLFNRARKKLKEATIAYLLRIDRELLTENEYNSLSKWIDPRHLSSDISDSIKQEMKDYFNEDASTYNNHLYQDYHNLIDHYLLSKYPIRKEHIVADFGMGTGIFAGKLSRYVKRVDGYDFSNEMCSLARQSFKTQKIENVMCKNQDFLYHGVSSHQYDYAYCITVLHHITYPQQAVQKMVDTLKIGGALIVSDFAKHKHTEIVEARSDLWYGFTQKQVHEFLKKSGLKNIWVEVRKDLSRLIHLKSGNTVLIPTIMGGGEK
jgi:RNA polymerase sigma-70 factor, ECF subfamily